MRQAERAPPRITLGSLFLELNDIGRTELRWRDILFEHLIERTAKLRLGTAMLLVTAEGVSPSLMYFDSNSSRFFAPSSVRSNPQRNAR